MSALSWSTIDSDVDESSRSPSLDSTISSDQGFCSTVSSPSLESSELLSPDYELLIQQLATQMAMFVLQVPSLLRAYETVSISHSSLHFENLSPSPPPPPSQFNKPCDNETPKFRPIVKCSPPSKKFSLKKKKPVEDFCAFCKNNYPEKVELWGSHRLRDENNDVVCPSLRSYICPYCGASGTKAHTIRYCSQKKNHELKILEVRFEESQKRKAAVAAAKSG